MDGGPTTAQRRVLVLLLALAALSLPLAAFVVGSAGVGGEDFDSVRFGLWSAGAAQPGLPLLLLAVATVVAVAGGEDVRSRCVRGVAGGACAIVVVPLAWTAGLLVTNHRAFGLDLIDDTGLLVVARLTTGLVYGVLALGVGAIGVWMGRRPGGARG